MSDEKPQNELVIVRRRGDIYADSPKTGVWKIAHADFMTAMMAFFLVMWLVNATDQSVREGMAQYFNPVKLVETSPHKKGLSDPDTATAGSPEEEGDMEPSGGGVDAEIMINAEVKAPGDGENTSEGVAVPGESRHFAEAELFSDPYGVLDKLAMLESDVTAMAEAGVEGIGLSEKAGARGGEADRDPFDPLYWRLEAQPQTLVAEPVQETEVYEGVQEEIVLTFAGETKDAPRPQAKPAAPAGATEAEAEVILASAEEEVVETAASELRREIEKELLTSGGEGVSGRLEVELTDEGLLISLTDDANFGMFAVGSAEPNPQTVRMMAKVAKTLKSRPGQIVIRGHTDARPFRSKDYDNWRLSTSRAHMARYMLLRGGLKDARVARVEGRADRDPRIGADPNAAANRRIEILLSSQTGAS